MPHHRITPRDIERFTHGDCHILARTIHRLTDWPMASFEENGAPQTHAFIKLPSPRHACRYYLDINGVQSTAQMLDRWGNYLSVKRIREFSEEEFMIHWNTRMSHTWATSFGPYSLRRARELAPLLLDLANS